MAITPPESKKPLARQLAKLLAERDGARLLSLMQQLTLLEPLAEPEPGPARIGIWVRRDEGGKTVWARAPIEPMILWSDMDRIEEKRSSPRVVFLGESVARGYFYDPHYGPAKALRTHLENLGFTGAELVDLARTDQSRSGVLALLRASLVLEPDAIVIFGGNNWSGYDDLSTEEAIDLAAALRSKPTLDYLRTLVEARLERLANAFVDEVCALAQERRIPVVFVIPEYNLADWRSQHHEAPLIEAHTHWCELQAEIREALKGEDYERVRTLASEIVALDGGTSPFGQEMLAKAAVARGDTAAAHAHLVRARDADSWMPAPTTPRCFAIVQDALRERGRARGAKVVDLPRIFAEWSNGEVPGRRFFHDYCHLTLEGIQVSMAAAATELASALSADTRSWRELARSEVKLDARARAAASLLGAVHNSSWGQPAELVRHHLAQAVSLHPDVATTAACVAEFCGRGMLPIMTSAYGELLSRGDNSIARFFADWSPGLHTTLVESVADVTARALPELAGRLEDIRIHDHAVDGRRLDLLDAAYWLSSHQQLDRRQPHELVFRAFNPASSFSVVCKAPRALVLELTHRLPSAGEIEVFFAGERVARLGSGTGWTRSRIEVDAKLVDRGTNHVVVGWPTPTANVSRALLEIADWIERGVTRPFHSVFGELAQLEVSA